MEPARHARAGRRAAVRVGAVGALGAAARLPEPAGGALDWDGKAQLPGGVRGGRRLKGGRAGQGSMEAVEQVVMMIIVVNSSTGLAVMKQAWTGSALRQLLS